jgi:hypothetical protein
MPIKLCMPRFETNANFLPSDPCALRRNFWESPYIDLAWHAAGPRDAPNGLIHARGVARGIGKFARRVLVAAPHEHDVCAILAEGDVGDFLAVVILIGRQLARGERRPFGHPDVAFAFDGQHPRDPASVPRRNQLVWKRRAHDLLECEWAVGGADRCRSEGKAETQREHHSFHRKLLLN